MHVLSNISRSKFNRAMKLGQLAEYNMKHIFLKISFTKWDVELSLRPFHKKSKLSISLDQQPEML